MMLGRVPRHRTSADAVDPHGTFVFIPGALASGFLASLALLLVDALRKLRGGAGARRRVHVLAAALTAEVRDGAGSGRYVASGLRRRWVYGATGAAAAGLTLTVAPGATWNYLFPGGYMSNIAWVWAISMLGVVVTTAVGVQSFRLAPEWVPVWAAAVTLGVIVRFVLGPESTVTRYAVIGATAAVGVLATGSTWRWRGQRHTLDVAPSSRALLAATPLGREHRTDAAQGEQGEHGDHGA